MRRPGPKTAAGKAAVRYNALQHGMLSATPVVPGLEREEDWQSHHAGILASLAPEGQLELLLAERVAQLLWRLRRVVLYERETIAVEQEEIDETPLDDLRLLIAPPGTNLEREHQSRLDRLRRERLLPDETTLQKIARYEAHLNRQLFQTLHELEAIQARRHGQPAPLARLDVHGIPGT